MCACLREVCFVCLTARIKRSSHFSLLITVGCGIIRKGPLLEKFSERNSKNSENIVNFAKI